MQNSHSYSYFDSDSELVLAKILEIIKIFWRSRFLEIIRLNMSGMI